MNHLIRKICVGLSLSMRLVSGANATYVDGNPLRYTDPTGLIVTADPIFQPTLNGMINNSATFSNLYNNLNARTADYDILPMNWTNPTTWFLSDPASGMQIIPGTYSIGIASDVTSYCYPGVDGKKYHFTMQRVLAHELAHASGIAGQTPTINLENKILNELNPNGIARDSSSANIYRPGSCACGK